MNRKAAYLLGAAAGALAFGGAGRASETVTYTYDALGRLVAVATSGGPMTASPSRPPTTASAIE